MAASYDNSVRAFSAGNVSSLTSASWAIAGPNAFLAACALSGAGSPVDPASMKWGGSGGTNMSKQGSTLNLTSFVKMSLYILAAPAITSATLYVDYGTNQDETAIVGQSAKDAHQSAPIGTVATNTGTTSTTITVNAVTTAGELVMDFAGFADGGGAGTFLPSGSQNSVQEVEFTDLSYEGLGTSWAVASGASTTMSWTLNAARDGWATFAFAVKAAAVGGGSNLLPKLQHHGAFL